MKMNFKILNISAWASLLTILFFPGNVEDDATPIKVEFGFPLRFFIQYDSINDSKWFASNVNIQLLYFFINVIIIYCVILILRELIRKIKGNQLNGN